MNPNLSKQIYMRDGWKCRHCGSRNNLTPHHVIYQSHGGLDVPWNLITLCISCHNGVHHGDLKLEPLSYPHARDVSLRFTRVGNWRPE